MTKNLMLGFVILFFTIWRIPAEVQSDALWSSAVAIFESNRQWSPGRMTIISREIDRKGAVKNEELTELEIGLDENGDTVSKVVRVEKNGREVTPEQGSANAGSNGGGSEGDMPNPLDPAYSERVSFHRLADQKVFHGLICAGYAFKMSDGRGGNYAGTIWISIDGGIPLALTATLDPLPRFVDSFMMEFYFTDDPRAWYAERAIMEGSANILLIKRSFSAEMTFGDYFIKP